MPRIFTPPDYEFDRSVPKILIRNCSWTEDQLNEYINHLSDKIYDVTFRNFIKWSFEKNPLLSKLNKIQTEKVI